MKNPFKFLATGIVVAVALFSLEGCQAPVKNIQLTVSLYKQEITANFSKLTDAFTAANPGIAIVSEVHPNDGGATQAAAAAAGKLPDIIQTPAFSGVTEQAKNGYLLALDGQPILSKVSADFLATTTYNGKIYSLPMDVGAIGILYNKDLFTKLGLTPPTTYLELQQVAVKIKQAKLSPFAGLLAENWSIGHFLALLHSSMLGAKVGTKGIYQFVDDMNAGKGDWGKDVDLKQLFAIIDWYKNNMSPAKFQNKWDQQVAEFATGKAAMVVQGQWLIQPVLDAAAKANNKFALGFIPFPWSNNAADNRFFASPDSTFAISAQSTKDKQDAALKFLGWLDTPEAIAIWTGDFGLISTFIGADMGKLDPAFGDYTASADAKGVYPWIFSMCPTPTWNDAYMNGALGYVLGKSKPSEIVASINASWKANYKE